MSKNLRKRKHKKLYVSIHLFVTFFALFLLSLPCVSTAGGLYLNDYGTPSMGVAGAGANAMDSNVSTSFHNPAGMTASAQSRIIEYNGLFSQNPDPLFYLANNYQAQATQNESDTVNTAGDTSSGDEEQGGGGQDGYTDAEIAEMINNPLGNLWMLFMQNDTMRISGDILDQFDEDDKVFNTFMIMPVMPMQLTDNYKYIFRPVIPIHSYDLPSGISFDPGPDGRPEPSLEFDRETGLGDIVLWNAFSTNEGAKPPNIFSLGFTAMLDTASKDELGTGKYSAGPMGLVFRITDKWIFGTVVQHWWSFAGDSDRSDVSLTDIQYVIRYRVTPETNIGIAPNVRYDWERDSKDDRLSFPIGIGADTMIKIGPLPVKIGAEGYYYPIKPDAIGPEWQLRLIFTPVIPSPGWSKKPIF